MNNKAPDLKLDCTITALIPGNPDGELNISTFIYWEEFIFPAFEDARGLLALGTALAGIADEEAVSHLFMETIPPPPVRG